MRLIKFLNEEHQQQILQSSISNDALLIDIKKNCQKFLKDIKGKNPQESTLWRGSNHDNGKYKVSKFRKPRDTHKIAHEFIDKIYSSLFGIKLRSESLFCSKVPGQTTPYGSLRIIIPIGNYKLYQNTKMFDMYGLFRYDSSAYEIYTFSEIPFENILKKYNVELLIDSFSLSIFHPLNVISNFKTPKNVWASKLPSSNYMIGSDDRKHEHGTKLSYNEMCKKIIDPICKELLKEIKEIISETKQVSLDTKSSNEIMVVCNEFWLLDNKTYQSILSLL